MMILKDKKNYYKNIFKGTKLWDETEKIDKFKPLIS